MRRISLLLVAVLALSGCSTIPLRGDVQTGGLIGAAGQTDVEYLPAGPTHNADQRAILEGFLNAGSAPQNNYRIAREFLTDKAAESWKPATQTLVRVTTASVTVRSDNELDFGSTLLGSVDDQGVYTPSTAKDPVSLTFGFAKIDGQWRISSVPDLTILTEIGFASAFNEYTVYYFSHDRSTLIPEVRVFARQADPVTAVARAVIRGPSERLPNAETAFPTSVQLATVPVDVTSGHAVVDLSAGASEETETVQKEMVTQMAASLRSQSRIKSVGFTVNNVALAVEPNANYVVEPKLDNRPLVLRNHELGFASKTGLKSIGSLGASINGLLPLSVSYNEPYQVAAVQNSEGVYRVSYRVRRVAKGSSIVDPQVGGAESIWWVDPGRASRIAVDSASGRLSIRGPWSASARVVGLEVSHDAARVAIAVMDHGESQLFVAAVNIDGSGRPESLGGYTRLPITLTTVSDLAWADGVHIAVLGTQGGTASVELASTGGLITSLGEPRGAVRISGGNGGSSGLVVRTVDGELWSPRGRGWQKLGIVADALATQN